jgi:DNA-directed RNA polymerase subunit RPC12/RpoP
MGLLDFVPATKLPEHLKSNQKGERNVEINCEQCGSKFMGYQWMIKKSQWPVICSDCWKRNKFEEEDKINRNL